MKKTFSTIVLFTIAFVVLHTIASCNNGGGKPSATTDSTASHTDSAAIKKDKIIADKFAIMEVNLPDHFDVIKDIYTHQAPFKQELVNPFGNVDFYTTSFQKEVNLGIYGVDLMYINFYGKNQDLLNYFSTIRKLAKELSFDNVFDQFADRFQSHSGEKDTVVNIVNSVFSQVDIYLNKNDRYIVASHIFAGAVIEVNYLSLNLLNNIKKGSDNEALLEKIRNENRTIYDLINLFEECNDDGSKALLMNLKKYRASYDQIIKTPEDLNKENINKLIPLITDVRNMFVSK